MKVCTGCNEPQPIEQFYTSPTRTTASGAPYVHPRCKRCFAKWYDENKEVHKRRCRSHKIRKRYGLTLEEYDTLIAQGCSVCGESATTRIVLDHCHATDSVRAPLCNNCNVALGAAQDSPERLRALAEYLEQHAARPLPN